MSDEQTDQPQDTQLAVSVPKAERTAMTAGGPISAIVPRDHVEAFRFAEAFLHAGMIPPSYAIKRNAQGKEVKEWDDSGILDLQATKARLAIGIMKGMEIGLPPVTALSTICVINNRPCLWGDGAMALIQQSGKCEYTKDWHTGDWNKGDYVHFFEVKRRDSTEPVIRSFGSADAKAAGLTGKKGPWASGYGPRMCMNRARAWAQRDAFSDVLMGIGIAEEVRDIPLDVIETKPDISSLDDAPAYTPTILGGTGTEEDPIRMSAPVREITIKTTIGEPDDLTQAIEEGAKADPIDPDWLAVLEQLKRPLESCENMAQFQLFWLDEVKTIGSLSKAPDNVQDRWSAMIKAQQAKFKK